MSKNTTDEQIAMQVPRVPEMFGFLIERYEGKLDRYIHRQTGLAEDLRKDVLQDVFIKSYENISSFDPEQSFNSWIYRICHNTVINDWKKNRPYREGASFDHDESNVMQIVTEHDETLQFAQQELQSAQIAKALGQIKEKYRSILMLRFFEEQSYAEISDILHMPSGTVATNINRAKKTLFKQITKNNKL